MNILVTTVVKESNLKRTMRNINLFAIQLKTLLRTHVMNVVHSVQRKQTWVLTEQLIMSLGHLATNMGDTGDNGIVAVAPCIFACTSYDTMSL